MHMYRCIVYNIHISKVIKLYLWTKLIFSTNSFQTYCQSEWEDISIICPNQCVCQRSYFNDLPISRWIMHFDNILDGKTHSNIEDDKSEATKNEAYYEDDKSHHKNRPVKFVMCMVQADTNVKALLMSIPQDVNALSLLYTGSKTNYTGMLIHI